MQKVVDPIRCDRCGSEADTGWCDVTTWGGSRFILGRCVCTTPGCVDEDGSSAVPPPDVPGQLTREDHRWIRAQQRLIDEYERVTRALADTTSGW